MALLNKEPEKIIQDILLHELELPANYGEQDGFIVPTVYVVAPNVQLGDTEQLQIGIQTISERILSSHSENKDVVVNNDTVHTEIKEVVVNSLIQIDIRSRDLSARQRRLEVIAALESIYAKQMQEKWMCRIFEIPTDFRNASMLEGTAHIYRYTATVAVQHINRYTHEVGYYAHFPFESSIDDLSSKQSFIVE